MQSPPPPPPLPNLSGVENGGQNPRQPTSPTTVLYLNLIHNITQICLGGIIVIAIIIVNLVTLSEILGQHIILCTTGYFILMTQAILSFSPVGWANSLKYEKKKVIHLTMHTLGCILAISGGAVAMANTSSHFVSAHAICGFIAFVVTTVSFVGGILKLIFSQKLDTKLMYILHSCVGSATMCIAFIALLIAFHEYFRFIAGESNANFAIVLTMFALVGTLFIASVKNARRILNK